MFDWSTYICVLTWRYGSEAMRRLWSLDHRFHVQRQVWVAQAKAQLMAGLASEEQITELASLINDTDIAKVFEKEKITKHDIVAALEHFKDQAPLGGNLLHQGMTSEDNTSNLDIVLIRNSLYLIIEELENLLNDFASQIERHADRRCCGFTHWQAASTTTVGHRLAMYATDLMIDLQELRDLHHILLPKGLKGAVGTRSTLCKMLKEKEMSPDIFEYVFLQELGLPNAWTVTGQTYTRKIDFRVFTALASLSQSLHKFGQDMRLLKSTPFNEMTVLFKKGQKGSSAMPHKRNPINDENLCSLARPVLGFVNVAWINAACTGLERTLDESGNRRLTLPISFLTIDECLKRARRIVNGLAVKEPVIARNLATIGVFAGLEHMILHLQEHYDLTRSEAYSVCQTAALDAWGAFEATGQHNLANELWLKLPDEMNFSIEEISQVLTAGANDAGDAPERARALVAELHHLVDNGVE